MIKKKVFICIILLINRKKHQLGSSAEGHVSHILVSRMSSRPQGWSREELKAMIILIFLF
ncbi:hypothetical protein DYH56_13835 [Psychrilyobacter piezotolerans]|uniref:Uncharacterized protein n=1 Tax=Psychrilyobacter piezotolerans TaxID=2293438 RepID=A0ABX9KEN1_9FUSO|nr:hypothetical protein [Psychrilyobacter piezotolerans]RDE59104.1 hypothetical protein DV867_13835 [Psychrilyobacter sp. S5]REI39675.1 hypothetical protein DYH56_13835 [Psychrilyobacter piezotolerans]